MLRAIYYIRVSLLLTKYICIEGFKKIVMDEIAVRARLRSVVMLNMKYIFFRIPKRDYRSDRYYFRVHAEGNGCAIVNRRESTRPG